MDGSEKAIGLLLAATCLTFVSYRADAMGIAAITPFETIRSIDLERTRMRGAGCAWMTRENGPIRFVTIDDRAMVRIGGRLRMLAPTATASAMFPFTHDRWAGSGIAIKIVLGKLVGGHGESSSRAAVLLATVARRKSTLPGILECGT